MRPCCLRGLLPAALLLCCTAALRSADEAKPSPEQVRFFETKVRPILADNCFRCHAEVKHKGSLRVDSLAALLAGGDRGPALVPGQPENSLLIKAINHDGDLKMPEGKKLPAPLIADLTAWIKMGAPWPGNDKTAAATTTTRRGEFQITDADRAHWAFQPVKRPPVPSVKNPAWVRNPVDSFILARLETKGLEPNGPAAKAELMRRVCYDLTGLPPTPQEVEAFVKDSSPTAYEALVDRLLDSPRYGEKWGRHWLDLVRFAETNSYERDNPKPNAWRYRDYVIRSFNQDKPYDRFVREQLAGDELPDADTEALIATGYYRLGLWDDEPVDPEQARYDGLDDIVATTGQVFLGLTFDCARCHDHKIDPIPQKDYYRLVSFFHNINHFRNGGPTDEVPLLKGPAEQEVYEQRLRELAAKRKEVETEIEALEGEYGGQRILSEGARLLGAERFARYQQLRKELDRLRKQKPPAEQALCVSEAGPRAPDTFVLLRGNPHVKGDKVEPAFPVILNPPAPQLPQPAANARTSGRRLALANWIASPDNQLTARVMANRLWQYHFGRGIVRSSSNFGLQGDRPTHPELLDFLASELVDQGWHLKPLHRLIVTSNAYRLSSRANPAALAADPVNDLCWRFDMRRLTAEEIRDTILSLSGTLNLKMYGPGVYPEIPPEVLAGQSMPGHGWGKSPPEEQARRSIYIHVKRSLLTPLLERFDVAETDRSSPVRFATTQPTQALTMINSTFLNRQAELFAARLRHEAGDDTAKQVPLALRLATTREPSADEVRRGVRLIEGLRDREGTTADVALKYFCLVVLNLNELVYLD
jgi:hypothetical protein